MKANKIFAAAMAALALVGFSACEKKTGDKLELTETSVSMKVGETHQLVANVTVETWTTSAEEVATVDNKGLVTAVKEGTAIISATANGVTKTCVVSVVSKDGGKPGSKTITASKIWPVVLDGVTAEANKNLIAGDLRVDDTNNFLDVWAAGETYIAGEGTGMNFFGNSEGYVALQVAPNMTWSGGGFRLGDASVKVAEELRQAIVADPDNFFLHIAMKATTTGNHQFYTFGDAATSFAIGSGTIEAGQVVGDFPRDGAWHEFNVPMAQFVSTLSGMTFPAKNTYILCMLSGAQAGSQLNLDAVYFYKK